MYICRKRCTHQQKHIEPTDNFYTTTAAQNAACVLHFELHVHNRHGRKHRILVERRCVAGVHMKYITDVVPLQPVYKPFSCLYSLLLRVRL